MVIGTVEKLLKRFKNIVFNISSSDNKYANKKKVENFTKKGQVEEKTVRCKLAWGKPVSTRNNEGNVDN